MIELKNEAPKERRDAAEHRQRILAAARGLFAQQDVDATNMTEIARAAGIGQGTLYRRFAHKGELCEALLKENFYSFKGEMESFYAASSESSALERLEELFVKFIAFNEENHHLLTAILDSACGPRRTEFYTNPFYLWLHGTITQLLEQAIASGEMNAVDAPLTAHLVIAPFKVNLYLYQRHELGYSSEQVLQSLRHLLINGLRAR